MRETYQSITFRPDAFQDFLLNRVGFTSCEEPTVSFSEGTTKGKYVVYLFIESNPFTGFRRPIQVYYKGAKSSLSKAET
jgi:hypothetical protein